MISTEILELMLVCFEDDVWASAIRRYARYRITLARISAISAVHAREVSFLQRESDNAEKMRSLQNSCLF